MLHGDAAAEPRDAIHRTIGDRFRVVEEPVESRQRNIAIHAFERIERTRDSLVIGRV
jgi:hypothetical protein